MELNNSAALKVLRTGGLLLTAGALALVSACSTLGPDPGSAAQVALAFQQSLAADDGDGACALLAPETEDEVAKEGGGSCATALPGVGLPDSGAVKDSQAFGRSAQVVLDDDVLFLAIFDGQWRITAAGCTPRGEQPYDCLVEG